MPPRRTEQEQPPETEVLGEQLIQEWAKRNGYQEVDNDSGREGRLFHGGEQVIRDTLSILEVLLVPEGHALKRYRPIDAPEGADSSQ